MVKEYNEVMEIVESKLSTIGFYLEKNNEFDAIFGNGTNWKITLEGERYVRPAYDLFVKKIDIEDRDISQDGFCVRVLFDIFGLHQKLPINTYLNLLIENKDKIFDETFPYKEEYDKLSKIPDNMSITEYLTKITKKNIGVPYPKESKE